MKYNINFTDIDITPIIIEEDTIDTSSIDLALFGRIFQNYGEELNENLLNLLENFACPESPESTNIFDAVPDLTQTSKTQLSKPLQGQFWFNSDRKMIYYWNNNTWIPITPRGSKYAANWGQLVNGSQLPRPVNSFGYVFPYNECIWSVSPASINGSVDLMNCNTDSNAILTMQYRYANTENIVSGIANYLIIGISGNVNNGIIVPPLQPSPTPTITPSLTPEVTPSATQVTLTPTITSTLTPTPTSVTPTPSATQVTLTPTPTPTPTPTVSVTPIVVINPSLPESGFGELCSVTTGGSGSTISYFLSFRTNGDIEEGTSVSPASVVWNWLGNIPGDSPSNYEIKFNGSTPDSLATNTWYNLGTTINYIWTYTLSGLSGSRFVFGNFELRRISTGEVLSTVPLNPVRIGINVECV